jgi:hypothetical protein
MKKMHVLGHIIGSNAHAQRGMAMVYICESLGLPLEHQM